MLRAVAIIGFLLLPVSAFAEDPATVTLPTVDVGQVINYLHAGGSRAEADYLATKITDAAKADIARQQAAKAAPPSESAPPK